MKFTINDFESLKESVRQGVLSTGKTIHEIIEDYKGLSETRLLWDLFWLSKWAKANKNHSYYDTHITSALRKAVKELSTN